jgi:hypothetical protein
MVAITSPTSGGRSVGVVRSRTQTMEFSFSFCHLSEAISNLIALKLNSTKEKI